MAIRKVKETHWRLDLNGTHHLLSALTELIAWLKTRTLSKHTETLLHSIKEDGLEIAVKKTNGKYKHKTS